MRTPKPDFSSTFILFVIVLCTLSACGNPMPDSVQEAYENLPARIDYNFHVKPILSDRCYACHGPDENTRKGGLRLDIETEAFRKLASGNRAFVKGNLRRSTAFHRMISKDPDYQMPPPDSKLELNAQEIAVIGKWLEQGATWKPHWSFIPVRTPEVPAPHPDWIARNPIDQFIQQSLPAIGLQPTAEADKERLLRRVTMDLTGLPPGIEAIDRFLADASPDAYERVVDQLLDSEAHAERLTLEWLDIARYADSHGVSFDGARNMWPYRDWVIRAFRQNMPFDQFITRQVAGDLLPHATEEDQLATAFYRHNPMETSQGSIDEEYRIEYVAERTAMTGTAFLGLTVGCARCHDHKFDPISQREFYQLSAFFNNTEEMGLGPVDLNRAPSLYLFEDKDRASLDSIDRLIATESNDRTLPPADLQKVSQFIKALDHPDKITGQLAHFPFEKVKKIKRKKKKPKKDKSKKVEYEEVLIVDGNKKSEATLGVTVAGGKTGNGLYFDEAYDYASLKDIGLFEWYDAFSISAWIKPEAGAAGALKTIIGNSTHFSGCYRGWDLFLDADNRLRVRLIHRLPDNLIELTTEAAVPLNRWTQVGLSYDGSSRAAGIALFIDGQAMPLEVIEDRLDRSIKPIHGYTAKIDSLPLRIGKGYRIWTGDVGLFKGTIDEVRIFGRQLSPFEMAVLGETDLSAAPEPFLAAHARLTHPEAKQGFKRLRDLRSKRLELLNKANEVMVLKDRAEARKTYVLKQGLYNAPGEEVEPGTPAHILAFPEDYPRSRLGLAQWLTHRENPLTSRVIINRYWQMIFGTGIVKTSEDFGVQGELPTHPELLDWLAAEFMDSGWNLRHLLKQMVMSHTYRQSSRTTPEQLEIDPANRFLARGSSYRWPAEFIRDNALVASGLLSDSIGGPSVRPYQPNGLWKDLADFSFKLAKYKPDTLDQLYRRSLYTFVRRFSPHPFLINFDATNREVCISRRINTNTPLQALNLLNDPQFVEASRLLAERMQKEADGTLEEQLNYGFRLTTGVRPTGQILSVLTDQYDNALQHFNTHPALADSLLTVGQKPRDPALDKTRTAALALVANTIFNYDESYMKR